MRLENPSHWQIGSYTRNTLPQSFICSAPTVVSARIHLKATERIENGK